MKHFLAYQLHNCNVFNDDKDVLSHAASALWLKVCDDKRLQKGTVCVCVCVFKWPVCMSAGSVYLFISVSTHSWHCRTVLCHQGVAASVQMCACACACDVCLSVWEWHIGWSVDYSCVWFLLHTDYTPAGKCLLFKWPSPMSPSLSPPPV